MDSIGHLSHLHGCDTTLVLVSRAPVASIERFRQRMGWPVPWYSFDGSDFNYDFPHRLRRGHQVHRVQLPGQGDAGTDRALSGRGRTDPGSGVSAALHVLMCAAVIVLTWRSRLALPLWFQVAAFGCPVIWFGLGGLSGSARLRAGALSGLHHAVMAASMIWMITAMPEAMRMGPAAAPGRSATPAMSGATISPAVLAVSAVLVAYFALAAVPWTVRALSSARNVAGPAAAGRAAMSAGMAAMLLD